MAISIAAQDYNEALVEAQPERHNAASIQGLASMNQ